MTQPSGASLGMEEEEKEKKDNGITLTNPSWGCVNHIARAAIIVNL